MIRYQNNRAGDLTVAVPLPLAARLGIRPGAELNEDTLGDLRVALGLRRVGRVPPMINLFFKKD